MKAALWFCVVILALTPAAGLCEERPTADELLAAFEKSVGKLDRVKIEWNVKGRERAPFDQELTLFRDGSRWKTDRLLIPIGDRPNQKVREQTLIGDEIVSVSLRYDPVDDKPRLGFFGLTAFRDRIATRTWSHIGCPILFGRTVGELGSPLWTVMREAGSLELLPQTEMIDGIETYVLKSRGKFGEHKLWLDPASGALPRRIEVHKLPGDLLNDEQLGTATAPANAEPQPGTGRQIPRPVMRPHREYWTRIDKIQIENQKGIFVITGYEDEGRITFVDDKPPPDGDAKKTLGMKVEHKFRVDVDPQEFPEDAFKFAVEIPNGTLVSVLDSYPLQYQGPVKTDHEWFDGKIRPRAGK